MLVHDVRFSVRTLGKQPVFAITAMLTLALGIGATTAIFSVVNRVVLQDLPYPNPGQLYFLRTAMTDGRATGGQVSPAELVAIAERSQSIRAASGAFRFEGAVEYAAGEPTPVVYYGVAPFFFDVPGLRMTLGRGFTPEEHAIGGPQLAVLPWSTWRDQFGSNPGIVGSTLRLDRQAVTIVGVAAPELDFPRGADLWTNVQVPPSMTNHVYDAYFRARDGVPMEQVRSELALLSRQLEEQYPGGNRNRVLAMQSLLEYTVGELRSTLIVLLGGAAMLLLIACVNVTNLMLSRGEARAKEIAIRVAVGARRRRILSQLLTESIVLAGAGAIAGVLLAAAGVRVLLRVGPADLPRMEDVSIDATVLLFALGLTIGVGVIVGFAPAMRLLMTDVRSLVNEGGRGGSAGPWRQRMLGALVVAEIALAVVVVIGAGLLVRSFDKLRSTDPGFRPEGLVTFNVNLSPAAYPNYDRVVDAYREMTTRLRAINGVQSVSMASSLPLGGQDDFMNSVTIEGDAPREEPLRARVRSVGETYFTTMGIRMVSGRELTDRDRRDTVPVVVVNDAFVRAFLPGQNAVGRQVRIPASPINDPNNPLAFQRATVVEIVGVAADVKHASLTQRSEPSLYQPQDQFTYRKATVMVRSSQDPAMVIDQIRREIASLDRSLPLEFRLPSQVRQASLSRQLLGMLLMIAFGSAALVLAAVGIYGVMAYSVAQRTRELAIRAALGASSRAVRGLIVRQGVLLATTGIVLGVMGALVMSRLIASQLYEVSAIDVIVFVTVPLLLFGIALISSLIPATVAGRVDPALMLRSE